MHGLAEFIMRGRWQGIAVAAVASVLPFLSWVAGGVIALVTLRRGLLEGLAIAAGALAVVALLFAVRGAPPVLAAQSLLQLWVPVLVLAVLLRWSRSLAATVQMGVGLVAAVLALVYALLGDPIAFWRNAIAQIGELMTGGDLQAQQAWQGLMEPLLPYMTGLMATTALATALVSLFLGRWVQAMLYNPGGFQREFHGLDMGRPYAAVAVVVMAAALLAGPGLLTDVALVVASVFVLQTLALLHAIVSRRSFSAGWLVLVYALLPFAVQLLIVVGAADAVFKWRQRLEHSSGPNGSD